MSVYKGVPFFWAFYLVVDIWDGVSVPVLAKTKITENFPPAGIFAWGLRSENSLKIHLFYQN
jgi:hypothetical protein